jgi:hypothetical protein
LSRIKDWPLFWFPSWIFGVLAVGLSGFVKLTPHASVNAHLLETAGKSNVDGLCCRFQNADNDDKSSFQQHSVKPFQRWFLTNADKASAF